MIRISSHERRVPLNESSNDRSFAAAGLTAAATDRRIRGDATGAAVKAIVEEERGKNSDAPIQTKRRVQLSWLTFGER